MRRTIPLLSCVSMTIGVLCFGIGCASDNQSGTATSHPGDAVLKDPMGYKVRDDDFPSISGGGIGHYDKKAMDHDLKSVFDP
jgi:hypothetical protein